MSKIRVITGKRGAGKSRFCLRLLDRFREEGLSTAGIISPAVYTDGVKTAFMTMDARTGNTRPCGTRTDTGSGAAALFCRVCGDAPFLYGPAPGSHHG